MSETTMLDVAILNRTFKIKVENQNLLSVKQRVLEIQEKLALLKSNFPRRDFQDYLSMALIESISSAVESENEKQQQEVIINELNQLNSLLD